MKNQSNIFENFDNLTQKGKIKIGLICKEASKIFSERGYHSSSLSDISHYACISKGGIYHYFPTKEKLLFVILHRYMRYTLKELRKKLKLSTNPHEKIRIFISHHINHYGKNLHESRLILHESQYLPSNYFEVIKNKEKEYIGILKSIIKDLLEEGEDNPQKLTIITYSLIGMCNWPYIWYDPKGAVSPEELAEEIYNIFIGDLAIKTQSST